MGGYLYNPGINEIPIVSGISAIPSGLDLLFLCSVGRYGSGLNEAEFRAIYYANGDRIPTYVDLRLVSEGGTFVPNGTTRLQVTGIIPNQFGAFYQFTSGAAGRWFFAFRLKNDLGWGPWSDGNENPENISDVIDTSNASLVDANPPDTWGINVAASLNANKFIVTATRPQNYGQRIKKAVFQIMDSSTGTWRALDANLGEAVTRYDGSAISHTYDPLAGTITKAAGNYGDAATYGGWLMVDVRGSAFNNLYCQVIKIDPEQCDGATISGILGIIPKYAAVGGVYLDIRIRIVKPPDEWNANGYSGIRGLKEVNYSGFVNGADTSSLQFSSPEFDLPAGVDLEDIEARVWFENDYCQSDNNFYSTAPGTSADIPFINELPLGDFSNFLNPGIWERHPDRHIQVYPQSDRVTLASLGDDILLTGNTMAGMMFRARILPDANGETEITCRVENINIGSDAGAGALSYIFGGLVRFYYTGYDSPNYRFMSYGCGHRQGNGFQIFKDNYERLDTNPVHYPTVLGGGAPLSYCDLRLRTLSNNPAGEPHRCDESYSIDGAAYVFDPGQIVAAQARPRRSFMMGQRFGVAIDLNWDMPNFQLDITNFQVVKGIIIPDAGTGNVTLIQPSPPVVAKKSWLWENILKPIFGL